MLPERPGSPADDPFGGRSPTSHERMTGLRTLFALPRWGCRYWD
jgi:hypothetical protein